LDAGSADEAFTPRANQGSRHSLISTKPRNFLLKMVSGDWCDCSSEGREDSPSHGIQQCALQGRTQDDQGWVR
jgi:hypothetical protein